MTDKTLRERREAVVLAHFEAENRQDWDESLATFEHPRYEFAFNGSTLPDAESIRAHYLASREAFPDQSAELIEIRCADDAVVLEAWILGTNTGPWNGEPPTGRSFRARCVALFLFEDGTDKMVCERVYYDRQHIREQLQGTEA